MARFVAVKHLWWMHHIDWKTKILDAVSQADAAVLARAWNDETNKPFQHSQVTVLELADTETLSQKGQKLTFWQRLTGRL